MIAAIAVVLVAARPGAAGNATRHVRALDRTMEALIADGARRSPLFRSLVEAIERSNVIVYVESRLLPAGLNGQLTLAGAGQSWRYLRIGIDCRQSRDGQIASLGHELQHAVEIADAGSIVDQRSIQALYGRIGFSVDRSGRRFESEAARHAGAGVRRDLSSRALVLSQR
jgi:hypothetical protein